MIILKLNSSGNLLMLTALKSFSYGSCPIFFLEVGGRRTKQKDLNAPTKIYPLNTILKETI